METVQKETPLEGNTITMQMPDGNKVTLRETNGADEEFMQRESQKTDGLLGLHGLLAKIVTKIEGHTGPITLEVIKKQKSRNLYFMLFLMRVHSLGPEVKFEYHWPDMQGPNTYSENLEQYLPAYDEKKDDEEYYKYAILPYPDGATLSKELMLASNKKIRYSYLTGDAESKILELSEDKQNVESELFKARNMQFEVNSKWQDIKSFHQFSSRDMAEIRADVEKYDGAFQGMTDVSHPHNPALITQVTLVQSRNFFFPVGL